LAAVLYAVAFWTNVWRQVPLMAKQPAVIEKPFEAVVEPVLEMLKQSSVAPAAVLDPIAKRVRLVSVLVANTDNFANGELVPMPSLLFGLVEEYSARCVCLRECASVEIVRM